LRIGLVTAKEFAISGLIVVTINIKVLMAGGKKEIKFTKGTQSGHGVW